jgi:small subunit ribosomal protein S18
VGARGARRHPPRRAPRDARGERAARRGMLAIARSRATAALRASRVARAIEREGGAATATATATKATARARSSDGADADADATASTSTTTTTTRARGRARAEDGADETASRLASAASGTREVERPARLSRDRLYYPGQNYEPSDLAAQTARTAPVRHTAAGKTVKNPMRGKAVEATLLERAAYEDARFLTQFVSDTGKIYPKRRLGVSAKAQRKIARAIKTARQMGILPYTSRLPQFQRSRET